MMNDEFGGAPVLTFIIPHSSFIIFFFPCHESSDGGVYTADEGLFGI
jgi:hypothetical protein